MSKRPYGLLFDMTACSGCRECVKGCMDIHGFPGDPEQVTELSSTAYNALAPERDYSVRKLCRHCLEPTCASVCPVAALEKNELGPVTYDSSRCIGCRYCMVACPFNIPRYEWDKPVPAVQKCDMCISRLKRGQEPACAESCSAGATLFGYRDELLKEAHNRIAESPEDYHPHVYGEFELGGTSVLYLTPFPVEALGFKESMGDTPLPTLTWKVLEKIPGIVVMGGATLLALWWITRRRDEVARLEAVQAAASSPADRDPGKES